MTSPAATDISLQSQFLLSQEDVARFHNDGYLAPLTAFSPQQMERLRPAIDEAVAAAPPDHDAHHHNRHLDSVLIWRLCTNHWIRLPSARTRSPSPGGPPHPIRSRIRLPRNGRHVER